MRARPAKFPQFPRRLVVAIAVLGVAFVPAGASGEPIIEPRNSGGGATTGMIAYPSPGMPPLDGPCNPDLTFTLGDGTNPNDGFSSSAFVFNTVISGYVGPVTMKGDGATFGCESYALGSGAMTVQLTGLNPTTHSRLDCNDTAGSRLVGTYTRIGSDMTLILSGDCVVNSFGTGRVMLLARIQVAPMGDPESFPGVLSPFSSATTAGTFVLAPA